MGMTQEYASEQKQTEKTARTPEQSVQEAIPNSAMISMLGASDDGAAGGRKGNPDALGDAVMRRLPHMQGRMQAPIPRAEQEADRLSASVNAGSPAQVKDMMGARLQADLSGVHFHTDEASAARTDAMGARAYTAGADVYFGSEGFSPAVAAHELVHTVQQGAVAGGVSTVSAPLGGVQMLGRKKKQGPAVGKLDFSRGVQLLMQGLSGAAKVGRVAAGDRDGVVKMGTNPEMESAMSVFYNEAGQRFGKRRGGWSFDAPEYRTLSADERSGAEGALRTGQLDMDPAARTDATAVSNEADTIGVYPLAEGQKPDISDQRENRDDYRRMLGYISMMDLAVGNEDRLSAQFNPENWHEESQDRTVHLLDNDLYANGGRNDMQRSQDAWLQTLLGRTSVEGGRGDAGYTGSKGNLDQGASQFMENMTGMMSIDPRQQIVMGDSQDPSAKKGITQAVKDLPKLQKTLRERFEKENGGSLNPTQQMILERLQITHEYMTNPKMAEIYRKLGEVKKGEKLNMGFAARANEDPETTRLRNNLLAQRDALRSKKHRSPLQWFRDHFHRNK